MRTSVDVHNYLVEREVQHEVFSARGRFRSPDRIAAVLDLPPEEVGKVVVFEGREGPVAAALPVSSDPDPTMVSEALGGESVEPASLERASELTGYLPESIPPAGLPAGVRLVIDAGLARGNVLYFPGGEARAVLKIRGTDLARATEGVVAPIAADPIR